MECGHFLSLLVATSDGVQAIYQEVVDDWLPEDPPVTTLFAALGDRIAEEFTDGGADSNLHIFALIEQAMENGDEKLATAVATGLIEAMVARAVQSENQWKQMAPLLGPRSLHHAESWLST
ncbi:MULTISPECIES: DUF7674 family protein [Lysobacter]|uniref:DUF7674 domain-containing protein n=1 Tax=Lysobacter gummosus TaxID=262324 RepID=A0ABY3XC84_9GAMM|nr:MULTISPECIES: hypothetical protein [Lysobacter]UJB19124.1 hypothetical protein L1A79_22890 [Lysobacter capsici]UJQ27151.1 hypothetical protein L2D09_16995 [Lysobacter gummosus]UNP29620.1 hypothetical protein MOV92_24740 [Lysobacter gummosus]